MRRHLPLIAGWAGATAVVVSLGWAAVATVAGAVADPPPLAQPPDDVPAPAAPAAPGQTPPADNPASPAPGGSQTFSLVGGTVGVRADEREARLVFATPNDGFAVEVRSRGPLRVDVRFTADGHETRFRFEPGVGPQVEERPD
ncbi:MAG TPA: hypothetical protein VM307_10845 [Egibacteraceae bacterium]|nr:hypothetical protein [Egibacteraceae bacterium]